MKFLSTKPVVMVIIGSLIVVGLVGAVFLNYRAQQVKADPQNQQKAVQEEVKKIVAEVGKLMDLPIGEDPTVATVTDITKLKDQPFFAKAKNGDKVLIYTNAKKAILYDPTAKKVIDVAPINIGTSSAQPVSAKIALRNGTATVGLTTKIEGELKKSMPSLNVVSKENAKVSDYEKTIVVLINGSFKDVADSLAKAFNTSLGALPAGEVKPNDTDILVILGKDASK